MFDDDSRSLMMILVFFFGKFYDFVFFSNIVKSFFIVIDEGF